MTITLTSARALSAILALLAVVLAVACAQSGETPAPTAEPAPTESAYTPIPTPPPTATPVPPTPTRPPPTVTATPRPTPRVIRRPSESGPQPAPDFEVETFDSQVLRMSDLEGKVVVLNFWASWCPPCRAEMPAFEQISQEYRDRGVVFFGIAMSDTLEDASGFAEQTGVTYPLALDTANEIARAYEVVSLPTTFFIGVDGRIERRLSGPANEGMLKVFIRGQLPR